MKRGISLIVLVVTIIVVIILSSTVIVTLNKSNPINFAKEAKFKQDIRGFQEELNMTHSYNLLNHQDYSIESQNAKEYEMLKQYIPDINKKYASKIEIRNGELLYIGDNENETKWIKDLNLNSESSWDVILDDANKNPEKYRYKGKQISNNIGIGTDKEPVNMDLWEVSKTTYINDKHIRLGKYTGSIIDGKIEGVMPQYIYDFETKKFEEVIELYETFDKNSDLVEVPVIPDTVTIIGSYAFGSCKNLKNINIPENITGIGYGAFTCTGITNITIPSNVKNIYDSAFSGCTELKNIVLPEGLENIKMYAFYGCTNLTSIVIPSSVRTINEYAFKECINITSINIKKPANSITEAPWGAPKATITWDYTGK